MIIKGRTFVISGGASGLGRAACEELHSSGGHIAIVDQNEDSGAEAVKQLGEKRARFWQADVTDSDSIGKAVSGINSWVQETGAEIGGVVCAAGVGFPSKIIDRKGVPMSMDMFDLVIKINLHGTIDLIRQLLPSIVKNKPVGSASSGSDDAERGVLILVSSFAAFEGQPGQVAYAASKGAIASLVLPLARDISDYGVRAVAIAPGVFESPMTAAMSSKVRQSLQSVVEWPKRFGTPKEFAHMVKTVVENSMINATTLRVDGGARMPAKI